MTDRNRFPRRTAPLTILLLAACLHGLPPAALADDDDDGDEAAPSRTITYRGQPAVRLGGDMQSKTDIRTVRLEEQSLLHEARSTGDVVDIGPLLESRSRYLDLKAEQERTAAALENSAITVERLSGLQAMDSNISKRELQAAQLQYRQEKIRLGALRQQLGNSRSLMRQQWGLVLADWATDPQSSRLEALAAPDRVLILVQSPVSREVATVYINAADDRAGAVAADYISPATRASANRYGNTFYYQAAAGTLRHGMRVHVWIPDPEREITGFLLPRSAIVWFNGQPWFYVHPADDVFMKKAIGEHVVTGRGWLLRNADLAGTEVVTSGAQMLLSEEYRRQIPDEDDNP